MQVTKWETIDFQAPLPKWGNTYRFHIVLGTKITLTDENRKLIARRQAGTMKVPLTAEPSNRHTDIDCKID